MEITDENIDDYPFVELTNDAKHLEEEWRAELNNFRKRNEDSSYEKLNNELEKDMEAYRDSIRPFQLEWQKLFAQSQEDARLHPEVLNQVKATHEILIPPQERLMKITTVQLEELENDTCEMNRLKNCHETIYTAEKEANKDRLEQLEKQREMLCVKKQDSDNFVLKLLSKCENTEMNNKETTLKNEELQIMLATLKLEMQKKEEDIARMKEYSNTIQQKYIEIEKRNQDFMRALQKSNECMMLMTTNILTTGEKNRNIQEQLFYAIKEKDCADKSTKLTLEQLFTLEEKFQTTEKKLNGAEETIVKLLSETQEKDREIETLKKRIAELSVLETELNEKNNIIKDIQDKYNMTVNEKKELLARICEYNNKIEELTKTLESERETVNANASMISRLMSISKEKEEALSNTQLQLTQTQEELAGALLRCAGMETSKKTSKKRIAELSVLETELKEKNNIIKDIKDKYNMTVNEKKELLARICEYNNKIEELTKTLESERETVNANASMISRLMSISKEKEEALSNTQLQLTQTQEELAGALLRCAGMETSKKTSKKRIAELSVLETELKEKNNIIKDIQNKYNITVNEKKELLARICEYNNKIEELTKTLESERETVNANASMKSQLMSISKEKEEALSNTQLQVTQTQEELAGALLRCAGMETSKKVNVPTTSHQDKEQQYKKRKFFKSKLRIRYDSSNLRHRKWL